MACRKIDQEPLRQQRFQQKRPGSDEAAWQPWVESKSSTCARFYWVSATIGRRQDRFKRRTSAIRVARTQADGTCSTSRQNCPSGFELCGPSQIYNRLFGVFAVRGACRCQLRGKFARESLPSSPAKELSKRWRFFPTYAGVRSSTVLRHPIPLDRDSEC